MFPAFTKGRVIGLLGGSFNPAHAAHLYLSEYALTVLPLDEIWWLVSPQNPMKSPQDMAPFDARFGSAKRVAAACKHIRVLDIETRLNSNYTCDTITYLHRRFTGTHFVWLMGADNLAHFHCWKNWQQIAAQVPLIVFDRLPHSHTAQRSRTYLRYRKFLLNNIGLKDIRQTPALAFIPMPRQSLSATQLRKTLGANAFLGHNEDMQDVDKHPAERRNGHSY